MMDAIAFGGNVLATGSAAAILFRLLCVAEAWLKRRYKPERDKSQEIIDRLEKGDRNFESLERSITSMKTELLVSVHALDRRLVVVETRLGHRIPRITREES